MFFILIPPPLLTKFSPSIPLWLVYEPTTPGYMGICHPNYPNFYWLLGPGTGLGTNSIIFMIECQVRQNNILILFRLLTCFCVWLLSCFAKLIQSEYLTKVYEIYVSRPKICTYLETESTVLLKKFLRVQKYLPNFSNKSWVSQRTQQIDVKVSLPLRGLQEIQLGRGPH